jgi:AraC-like DNA-binding protein
MNHQIQADQDRVWGERVIKPRCDKNRAFEHKSIAMIGDAEAIEQTFKRITREQQIKDSSAFTREIQ